jgi:hypothetical protein
MQTASRSRLSKSQIVHFQGQSGIQISADIGVISSKYGSYTVIFDQLERFMSFCCAGLKQAIGAASLVAPGSPHLLSTAKPGHSALRSGDAQACQCRSHYPNSGLVFIYNFPNWDSVALPFHSIALSLVIRTVKSAAARTQIF